MLMKSFLLRTSPTLRDKVTESLENLSFCTIVPSTNTDVIAVAVESQNDDEEQAHLSKIESIEGVQNLVMVFGTTV